MHENFRKFITKLCPNEFEIFVLRRKLKLLSTDLELRQELDE